MRRLPRAAALGLAALASCTAARPGVVPVAPLALPAAARVMVFAPHPDDETIAVGGMLARLAAAGTPVRVVFVTDGDGYPGALPEAERSVAAYRAFGQRRMDEARAALGRLGLRRDDARFLGFPDAGLDALWTERWARPYTSPYTRADHPPYGEVVDPEAPYTGEALAALLVRELADFRPSVVVLPHPADRHADHLHTAYFAAEAVHRLAAEGSLPPPRATLAYLVHYPNWPARRGPAWDRLLPLAEVRDGRWEELELAPAERAAKEAAVGEYATQLAVMGGFLRSFLCRNELVVAVDQPLLARLARTR
jgi:LmbE family N-acetylglucosaminyl deacetylase